MKKIAGILFVLLISYSIYAQKDYVPTQENLDNREWFQEAKFGMFIHWGIYSVMGGGGDYGIAEWIMNQKEIPIHSYERLADFFNPVEFDPAEWVSVAKAAGMNYITITSKHHDGFALYDSKVSDWDVVERTPYGKDILKQLKEECDKQGIKLFFYYSQLDWHHPDYYPRGRTGQKYTGRPESGDWDTYIQYMNAQLSELLTNFGDIGGIWFDGMWDQLDADWQLDETYSLIHKLQPGALIGSNHHRTPFPGEDFMMFERDLPGENKMGFNQTTIEVEVPLEMCETMNGSWGYNIKDRRFKSTKQLIQTMVKAAGYGKGPIAPKNWGATTQKGNTVFVHVMDLGDETLLLPEFDSKIKSVTLFDDKSALKYSQNDFGTLIRIPYSKRKPIDTIVVIELK